MSRLARELNAVQVAGIYPKVMIDRQMDAGAWSCCLVDGLIHDNPTVKELIDRLDGTLHTKPTRRKDHLKRSD
jgi:hypothetical protein